jgi:hypothetical protein
VVASPSNAYSTWSGRADPLDEALRTFDHEVGTPIDLTEGPLFRTLLLTLSPEEHLLGVVVHHAVDDGCSPPIFDAELTEFYAAFLEGREPRLPPPRHRARHTALRLGLPRTRHPTPAHHRRHRPPDQAWTAQQARNLAADLGHRMESLRFLLRDRDGKYGHAFDSVFHTDDLHVITSAPQAPRMNAHCDGKARQGPI